MHFNQSTMIGEHFEIQSLQMLKYALQSSTMVEENFEIQSLQMLQYALQSIHHGWRKL